MSEPSCFRAGSVHSITATDKYRAIAELIGRASALSEVTDLEMLEDSVVTRERIGSTGLGRGVAVAHGKTPLVDRVIVTLGISKDGIEFDSPDGLPVHLLFLVASPPHRSSEYLMALSSIACLCRGQGLKERLLAASTTSEAGRLASEAFGRALNSRCERFAGGLALSSLF